MEIYSSKKLRIIRWFIFAFFAIIFAADLYFVKTNQLAFIDKPVMDFCVALRDDSLTIIAKSITFMANTLTMLGLCILLVILPTRIKLGFPLGIATGLAALCHVGAKYFIDRPRPDHSLWLINVSDPSFPSGHANVSVVFYLFLMILLARYFKINKNMGAAVLVIIVLPLMVVAICASRLYLGVHFASDVIGGICLGACLLIIFLTIYEALWPISFQFTNEQPGWGNIRKQRAWRQPQIQTKETEMIQFPKNRSPWKRPNTTKKKRQEEEVRRHSIEERERIRKERRERNQESHL